MSSVKATTCDGLTEETNGKITVYAMYAQPSWPITYAFNRDLRPYGDDYGDDELPVHGTPFQVADLRGGDTALSVVSRWLEDQ